MINFPTLPKGLEPANRHNKDDIFNCLTQSVGNAYRRGLLRGWEDIDAAYTGFLVQEGFDKNHVLYALKSIFNGSFDMEKSEYLYDRALEKHRQGEPLIGCLLYTSPSPRDRTRSRMPSSA